LLASQTYSTVDIDGRAWRQSATRRTVASGM